MVDKKDIDLDELDLDDDIDWGDDFDPPSPPALGPREAATMIPKEIVKGGAKALAGEGKRRRIILGALPKDYTVAAASYDTLASTGREVYSNAKKELGQTKRELKRVTRELTPTLKRFLPKSLGDRVEKFGKDDSVSSGSYEEVDPKEAAIQAALSETFGGGGDVSDIRERQKERLEERATEEVEKAGNIVRQNNLYELVAGLRGEVSESVNYNKGPGNNYRRKMLEVNYRQLFALQDINSNVTTALETIVPNIEGILKNTALPDYAKEEFGEITSALMKREMAKRLSPAEWARESIQSLGKRVSNSISEGLSGFRDNLSMASDMASMAGDMAEEMSPEEAKRQGIKTVAGMAGANLARKYVNPHLKNAQEKIKGKFDEDGTVASVGRKLRYTLGTVPEYINDLASNPDKLGYGPLADFIESVLPNYTGNKAVLDGTTVESLNKVTSWKSKDSITLNEVIPGLLAKINKSVRQLGGNDDPIETYDYTNGQFTTTTNLNNKIRTEMDDEYGREAIKESIDEMVKELTDGHDISENAKESLGQILDHKIRNVSRFNIKELANNWDAYDSAGSRDTDELMDLFTNIEMDKTDSEKLNVSVSERINSVRNALGSNQEKVDGLVEQYGVKALVDAGVFIEKDGVLKFNPDINDTSKGLPQLIEQSGGRDIARANIAGTVNGIVDVMREQTPQNTSMSSGSIGTSIYQSMRDAMFGKEEPNLKTLLQSAVSDKPGEPTVSLNGLIERVYDQLVTNNLTPQVDNILTILNDLAVRGVPIAGEMSEGEAKERAGYFGKFGQQVTNARKSISSKLGAVGGFISRSTEGIRGKIMGAVKNPIATFKGGFDTIASGAGAFKDRLKGITSIYDADGNVVLHGRLLKAGKYFDADGKVIKTINDIKGAIYDENGELVISREDIEGKLGELTYYTKQGWQKLSEVVGKNVGGLISNTLGIPKFITDKVTSFGKGIVNHVMASPDIYVQGEDSPRLKQRLIRKGYYLDKDTGKIIRTVEDINGPVITRDGVEVISADELADKNFNLVDVNGKPFKTFFQKAKDLAAKGIALAKKAGSKVIDMVKGAAGVIGDGLVSAKDYVKDKVSNGILGKAGANEIVNKLDEIKSLLENRLESKKPAVFGDTDGDGDRDGSAKDIFANRKLKREAAKKAKAAKDAMKNGGKMGADAAKASAGFFGPLLKSLGPMVGSISSMIGTGIASVFGAKALGILTDGMGSIFKKLNPFGKKDVAKTAAKATAKTAGRIAASHGAKVAATSAATTAAKTAGGTALRALMWQGVRTAAMATVGVLSAPVTLTIAAVAGVGYLAYKAMTRSDALTKLRMAQYGTEDYADSKSEEVKLLSYLEDTLLKFTEWDAKGLSKISGLDKASVAKLAEEFEVDISDPEAINNFEKWFYGRFVPIYLLWTTRARQYAPGIHIKEIGDDKKVDPAVMLKIFTGVRLESNHPALSVDVNPFSSDWFGENYMNGEDVAEVTKEIHEDLKDLEPWDNKRKEKAKKDAADKKEKTAKAKSENKTTATESGKFKGVRPASEVWKSRLEDAVKNEDGSYQLDGRRYLTKQSMKNIINVRRKVAEMKGIDVKGYLRADDLTRSIKGDDIVVLDDETDNILKPRSPSNVNALEAIRLKAYGLVELDVPKVKMLWDLENEAIKGIKISKTSLDIMPRTDEVAKKFMAAFGMDPTDEHDSKEWKTWYVYRFFPVLVTMVKAIRRNSSGADPLHLNVGTNTPWIVDVATSIVGAKGRFEGKPTSVWQITNSPFPNYQLGTSVSVVRDNMRWLQEMVKNAKAMEQKKGDEAGKIIIEEGGDKPIPRPKPKLPKRPKTMIDVINEQYEQGVDAGTVSEGAVSENDDASSIYQNLRLRTRSMDDVADMLKEVAKITGVDLNTLLTFAMTESAMNPDASAKTSSAKGLFQFIDSTWAEQLGKHANKYGIPSGVSAFDPAANALMAAEFIKGNMKAIESSVNGEVGTTEAYLAHFLGTGGGKKFFEKLSLDPNGVAAKDFTTAARANPTIFVGGGKPLTYQQIYDKMRSKLHSNFRYVSKYSDKPILEKPKEFAKRGNGETNVSKPIVSEPRREAVKRVKVKRDIDSAVADSRVNEVVNLTGTSNVSDRSGNVINTLNKKANEVAEVSPEARKQLLADYMLEVEEQVKANAKKINNSQSATMVKQGDMAIKQREQTNSILGEQLALSRDILAQLEIVNRQLSNQDRKDYDNPNLAGDLQPKRKPTVIEHKPGPLNVSHIVS